MLVSLPPMAVVYSPDTGMVFLYALLLHVFYLCQVFKRN